MITPLHAANPGPMTGGGNWTYLLSGRHPVLIDAGVGHPDHLVAIASAAPAGPRHVLVTHAHGDHVSGAPAIAGRWPGTRFAKCPWPERDAAHAVAWAPLADGELVPAGDDALEVVYTPGHAPDHIAFWHRPSRTLFSGDLVVAGSTVVILASAGGSLVAYLASLARVLAIAPARLLPAHGGPIDDPAPLIREYIDHRHLRERQIRAALAAGVTRIPAIVERIYAGLAPALVPMARESVLAHLRKLQEEGAAQPIENAIDNWELKS